MQKTMHHSAGQLTGGNTPHLCEEYYRPDHTACGRVAQDLAEVVALLVLSLCAAL
jgi:hypothetical protein